MNVTPALKYLLLVNSSLTAVSLSDSSRCSVLADNTRLEL